MDDVDIREYYANFSEEALEEELEYAYSAHTRTTWEYNKLVCELKLKAMEAEDHKKIIDQYNVRLNILEELLENKKEDD